MIIVGGRIAGGAPHMVGCPPPKAGSGAGMDWVGKDGLCPPKRFAMRRKRGKPGFNKHGDPLPNFQGRQFFWRRTIAHGPINLREPMIDHLHGALRESEPGHILINA